MADTKILTGNPVPSADPRDRHDNSIGFDEAVTGKGDTWLDRTGQVRRTLHWMEKASTGIKAVEASLVAEAARDEAKQYASEAEAAASAAATTGGLYPSVAAGLADTVDGKYFSVVSPGNKNYIDLYLNSAGSGVYQKSYPAIDFFSSATLGILEATTVDTQSGVVIDSEGQQIIHVLRGSKETFVTNEGRVVVEIDPDSVLLPGGYMDSRNDPLVIDLKRGTGTSLSVLCDGKELLGVDTKKMEVRAERIVTRSISADDIEGGEKEPIPSPLYCPDAPSLIFDTSNPSWSVRRWQGIPSIARTGNRLWSVFYGGEVGVLEGPGNFVIAAYSDDGGDSWTEHMYVAYPNDLATKRVFDPQAWTDPDGKLWIFVAVSGDGRLADGVEGAWAFTCKNPEGEIPNWSTGWRVSYWGIPMMPAVINEQAYIPIDYWGISRGSGLSAQNQALVGRRIFSLDYRNRKAELISRLPPAVGGTTYDETSIGQDYKGDIRATYRVPIGTETCVSKDGGKTWGNPEAYSVMGPNPSSRIYYGATPSGRIAICYNAATDRSNLTLKLSEDGGVTFPYSVLIDARSGVTYPEIAYGDGGKIHIVYDYMRTVDKQIVMATVIESEVISGTSVPQIKIVSDQ